MIIDAYRLKRCVSLRLVRAHLCTAAVALSFQSTWYTPRQALCYGGPSYLLVFTVAMTTVAAPAALLQLAIGQLSQQDAVGVWRAVPFFKGIGYMRLIISFSGSVCTVLYVALTVSYFLHTISHSIPFIECTIYAAEPEYYGNVYNASRCLDETFLSPINEQPEYFIAVALIIIVIWVAMPFMFYNPVKWMKRVFYVLTPVIVILAVVVAFNMGQSSNLAAFTKREDWQHFSEASIWLRAVTQALMSSQIAGGFLISAGGSIYGNTNVVWSTLIVIGTNIVSGWCGVLLWYAVGSPRSHLGPAAILLLVYEAADHRALSKEWPLLAYATLILSGIITMFCFLYPIFDRCRRVGGYKWRVLMAVISLLGAMVTIATFAGRSNVLAIFDDFVTPLFVSITTVLEILAFILIYGSRVLVEDLEFLTSNKLRKYWLWGWFAAPGVILALTTWWITRVFVNSNWTQLPWETYTMIASVGFIFLLFFVSAGIVVVRQVHYDFIGKLRLSFKPSRHWGPRDPIAHYYWLMRREENERGNISIITYRRRYLGQFSAASSFSNVQIENKDTSAFDVKADVKKRANSDDWLYTGYRKEYLLRIFEDVLENNKRSRSLDLTAVTSASVKIKDGIKESNVCEIRSECDITEQVENINSVKDIREKKRIYFIT